MSTFDSSLLMQMLQKQQQGNGGGAPPIQGVIDAAQGNSQGITQPAPQQQPQPQQQSQQQPPDTPTDMSQQQPANNAQNAGPVKAGLRSVIGGLLKNFSYGAGQSMIKASGGETDAEQATRLAATAHINAQTDLIKQQSTMTPIQPYGPNGPTVYMPAAGAAQYFKTLAQNQGKEKVADINQQGKRFMAVPNVGLIDTQHPSGTPQVVSGSTPQSVTITPEMVQSNGIPAQLVGKTVPLSQFAQMERGGAPWAATVSNTTETKEVSDPNNPGSTILVKVPKTTSTHKVAPGAATAPSVTPQAPGQKPLGTLGTVGGIKTIVGQDGQPLQGKSAGDPVYAFDPAQGQQVFTTRADANAKGLQTPTKVTAAQADKDKSALTMFNDVQMNASKYTVAARDYAKNGGDYSHDGPLLAKLTSENPFNVSTGAIDLHLPAADIMNNIENSKAYTALTPGGKQLMDGWLRANAAVPAYQKGLTGIGRANKEMMDLELKNIGSPILGMDDVLRKQQAFQENIDQAAHRFPIFQDVKQPRQVRQEIEGAQPSTQGNPGEPPRPSSVPSGYVFNAKGPKGAGWYRP
jgi:hypothetical protein